MMSNFADMMQEGSGSEEEGPELEPWVRIQRDTFTKWMNEKLRGQTGPGGEALEVRRIPRDLRDGVKLCRLMEVLKGGKIGRVVQKKKIHDIEASGNLALALDCMKKDGVRLVNIGPSDIRSGNIKLILGMMWTLIRRYQIGSSGKLPPKKLMLSWCNAVLHPHLTVNNFGSDWNDGIALHGIIEYCKPGTCPGWYNMSAKDWEGNCGNALRLAEDNFAIPGVITAEDMASSDLDELSGMTYLSYFMAEGSPGFKATMDFVLLQISPTPVANFETDWNNGYILSCLVHSLGGKVPGWPNIDTSDWTAANQRAMTVSQSHLGVEPVISAKDLSSATVDHIGVMAYAAWHQAKAGAVNQTNGTNQEPVYTPPPVITPPPAPPPPPPPPISSPPEAEPTPPPTPSPPPVVAPPTPVVIQTDTMPRRSDSPKGPLVGIAVPDNWRSGCTSTFEVDTTKEGQGSVRATADSPSGHQVELSQAQVDASLHHLSFTPEEKGQWVLTVMYDGKEIQGSPFPVNVYDPSDAKIIRTTDLGHLDEAFTFDVDLSRVGLHDIDVFIVSDGERVDHSLSHKGEGVYKVTFTPMVKGIHNISVFSGGDDVTGSPFKIKVEDRVSDLPPSSPVIMDDTDIAVESSLTALDKVIQDYSAEDSTAAPAPAQTESEVMETPPAVRASGRGLFDGLTNKQTDFTLDTSSDPDKKLSVSIKGPSGCEVDYRVAYMPGDQLRVQYSPLESGVHTVDILYDGRPITGSPYHPAVKDGIVVIRDLDPQAKVGEASSFQIDASEVKKGTLEIDSDLPIHKYDKLGHNRYQVTFIPMKAGHHDLVINYNGEAVPGCPFEIEIIN